MQKEVKIEATSGDIKGGFFYLTCLDCGAWVWITPDLDSLDHSGRCDCGSLAVVDQDGDRRQ